MRHAAAFSVLCAVVVLASPAPVRAQSDGPSFERTAFDKPQSQRRLTIPAHAPDPAREVRCATYRGFMVKQVSVTGDMGAEAMAIVPVAAGHAPPCQRPPLAGEQPISLDAINNEFPGVDFAGVKGGFVFLASADAVHNAVGFAVVRSDDGQILFHDWSHSALAFQPGAPDGVVARYSRTFGGDCSVVLNGAACAQQIAQASGTTAPTVALCRAGYERAIATWVKQSCAAGDAACATKVRTDNEASPSVVLFPAELAVTPAGASARILGAPSLCWPAE
jgi:hypothetical protein